MNDGLYLSRDKGGRGLRSLEETYKEVKIKCAVKVKVDRDPSMRVVNRFHQLQMNTQSYSLFKEASKYATEKGINIIFDHESCRNVHNDITLHSNDEKCIEKISTELKKIRTNEKMQTILASNWQGMIYKNRIEDETVKNDYNYWLKAWKSCPTSIVSEIMQLFFQTLKTKCYQKTRSNETINDVRCRLCLNRDETC